MGYRNKTRDSRRHTVKMQPDYTMTLTLDTWPWNLFTNIHSQNAEFRWNPSTRYRDIVSREKNHLCCDSNLRPL